MKTYLAGLQRLNEILDAVPGPSPRAVGIRELDPEALDGAATLFDDMVGALLGADAMPAPVREQCRALAAENACAVVGSVAMRCEPPVNFAEFVAWKALGRVASGRGVQGNKCPTCGSLPAMATLVATERGRERELCCGLCGTRWKYARIGCPFCGGADHLGVLEPDGDPSFRIDVCRSCNSYLKTYVGGESDPHALSDWSTLHLDTVCQERGLNRPGPSLYRL